ncbi:hypothetical protein BCR39DRAFT_551581 [Naematelia encephala]|uniref:Myb-like domain-containing protein n=1 Tax=Naematelia encephala TaxID=71784 RepID=A0A1Y2AKF1_9TREE|nr:hypothetical protein BCR39DRAFT_551581 [Naematelia encephala]
MPAEPHTPTRPKRTLSKPYNRAPNTSSSAIDDDIRTPGSSSSDDQDSADEYRPPTPNPFFDNEHEVEPDITMLDDDDNDVKPDIKGKGKGKSRPPPKGTSTPKKTTGGSGGKAGTAWTPDETWLLFKYLYPRTKPDWAAAARAVGRDAKSCQNRSVLMQKKLEGAIKAMA